MAAGEEGAYRLFLNIYMITLRRLNCITIYIRNTILMPTFAYWSNVIEMRNYFVLGWQHYFIILILSTAVKEEPIENLD